MNKNDGEKVGGKAINLAKLAQIGINVPKGFCLTTKVFWQFLEENNLIREIKNFSKDLIKEKTFTQTLSLKLKSLQESIINGDFSENTKASIKEIFNKFLVSSSSKAFAVRSSATNEDSESASFAGQYDTFLNVNSLEHIIDKIKCCFASYWNERAFLYRAEKSIDHFSYGMAVVVQELVNSEAAGVLFTLNPLTGNEREMVIEACWGLGEALVSGDVTPDRFLLDPFDQKIQNTKIGNKKIKLVSDKEGTKEIVLSLEESEKATLEETEVLELAQIALKIQQEYGVPIDIEWAKIGEEFYILQARPLTAFSFSPDLGQWTSANFREVMPGVVNPLSFSLSLRYDYGECISEFLQKIKLYQKKGNEIWSKCFFGRPYWNVGIIKECVAKLPNYSEKAFDITVGITPSYLDEGRTTPATLVNNLKALPVFLSLQWMYFTFWREAKDYLAEYEIVERNLEANNYKNFSNEKLKKTTQEMINLHYKTNRIAMICSFLATESQNDFRQHIEKINKKLPSEKQVSIANLLTGLTEISTAAPMVELWEFASEVAKNSILKNTIVSSDINNIIDKCRNLDQGKDFINRLNNYLEKYKFIAPNDEDLSSTRWTDDKSFPLTILKNYLKSETDKNPRESIAKQKECREREKANALKNIGIAGRFSFLIKLDLVAHYCRWREMTRVPLSRTYYQCQRVFLEQGARFVLEGVLEKKEDIFWLEREELLDLLEGKLPVKMAKINIKRAKLIAECYRNFDPPTVIGQGLKLQTEKIVSSLEQKFIGVACSAGEVIAKARIINSLSEASRLERGEIMIAPHTNPGWTPLFSLASAIVLEEGGLLSHGAVVARECGIPTVLQIKNATKIFSDGQLLRVNGSKGEVEILEK
jgi:pyruvate,water dikinase